MIPIEMPTNSYSETQIQQNEREEELLSEKMSLLNRRFAGVRQLVGQAAFDRLRCASIAIIGIGGVGSWVAEALARSGVGQLTLIDLDHVTQGNTNRQIHALAGHYGQAKVVAMAERIERINPQCRVVGVEDFIERDNLDTLLATRFAYVIDAIDNVRAKADTIAWCVRHKQPIITIGGAGGRMDPTQIKMSDLARTINDPLLAKVRAQLRRNCGFPQGTPSPKSPVKFNIPAIFSDELLKRPTDMASFQPGLNCAGLGSNVCVTASFGLVAAAYVVRILSGEKIKV